MNLSQEVVQFLVTNIQRYFPANEYQIILFGSYAKGKERENSDIDIAIKGNGPILKSKWQEAASFFEESYLKQKVDLVDYHRVSQDFQEVIDREGIRL